MSTPVSKQSGPAFIAVPPSLDQMAASLNSPNPHEPVTPQNVEAIRSFLRQRGFFGSTEPDEMDDYFPLYVEVAEYDSKHRPRSGPAPTSGQARGEHVQLGSPGTLFAKLPLVLYTNRGAMMFSGRSRVEAGPGSSEEKAAIPGFIELAGWLRMTTILSNRGNPYADLQLLMINAFIKQNLGEIKNIIADAEAKRAAASAERGFQIELLATDHPAVPSSEIRVATRYAVSLHLLLIQIDRAIRLLLTLATYDIEGSTNSVVNAKIVILTRTWRQIIAQVEKGWKFFLSQTDVRELTRAGRDRTWPKGREAFCIKHFRIKRPEGMPESEYPLFPENVWKQAMLPPHKSEARQP